MQLQTSTAIIGDVLVVNCKGRIVMGDETAFLRHQVRDLMNDHSRIILNLAEVDYVDSTGIGTLVGLYSAAESLGANIVLAALTKRIQDLLQITKLVSVFETFSTVEEAVAKITKPENSRSMAKSAD